MKNEDILDFLKAIDSEMAPHAKEGETLELCLIGRSALILRYGLNLATKDVDFVQYGRGLENKAVEIFGKGSRNAESFGFYLEQVPAWHEAEDPDRERAYANLLTVIDYLEGNRRKL